MHIQHIPELVEYQRKRIERLRHTTDLPAPWEVYPDIPSGSIGWRMGPGEDVYADWRSWLSASTTKQREEYCKRHPEPEAWVGTYEQMFRRFASDPHGLNWDAFWDAEFKEQCKMYGPVA